MEQTWLAQPALFVVEYALAQLWISWGIRPAAMIGHSIGEYVAACLAGVFTLEDALALIATRGRLMQQLPGGSMLAVALGEQEVRPRLGEQLSLAAINGPAMCVVSGPDAAVEQLERQLTADGVECRRLHTSHAFHSAMMEAVLDPFAEQVRALRLQPPAIPYISNVTGMWVTAAEATSAAYWARQLRQAVRFGAGIQEILRAPNRILLEVGPGRSLSRLAHRQNDGASRAAVLSSLPHPLDRQSEAAFVLTTLGQLWLAGAEVNWSGFYGHEQRRRIPLPSYPFERQRFWLEPDPELLKLGHQRPEIDEQPAGDLPLAVSASLHPRPSLLNAYVAPRNEIEERLVRIWQEFLGVEPIGVYDNFFELGGHSLLAGRLIAQSCEAFGIELALQDLLVDATVANMALVVAEVQRRPTIDQIGEPQQGPLLLIDQQSLSIDELSDEEVDRLLYAMLETRESVE